MDAHRQNDRGKARRRGFLARFARDRRGATAIEFGLLAIPFFLLVFAILESCISFAAQEVMANATDNTARRLRTGQDKAANVDANSVRKMICDQIQIIVSRDCPGLKIDLRTFDTFAQAAQAGFWIKDGNIELTYSGTKDAKQFVVEPGRSMSKNMLRVFYAWPVMTDLMAKTMANLDGGKTLHYASAIWQNEPFND